MPAPIPVELTEHDPRWAQAARDEAVRVSSAIGGALVTVHHIGSTAIPGLRAKPILDLIPTVTSLSDLDKSRVALERIGYLWWGEYGLSGRRYCTLDDPRTGRRRVQLHCFEAGSSEIRRHLAFRDYLRLHPELVRGYEMEKCRCRNMHPLDSHAYGDCKGEWIRRIEALALA